MNLLDFDSDELVGRLVNLTSGGVLTWYSDFPVPLDDPNNQTYYFSTSNASGDIETIYLESNYDPVFLGGYSVIYWYEGETKKRIILNPTTINYTNLVNSIGTAIYSRKIVKQGDKIDDLNAILDNNIV